MKQQPNFFEKLGLADKEKIHSQIISWLFSQELQLIDESTKSDLYSKLFKCELPEKYAVYTEWKNMDVVFLDLTGDKPKEALVIENKLKSELHSNQLTKYY
ncbi:MAG: PD-(D/E)XK nuclease family protein, partial [Flavobacteriia bacterium]